MSRHQHPLPDVVAEGKLQGPLTGSAQDMVTGL
ncbi:hypothetical protein NOVOSPHI9U_10466 [Novosphingobium sp. 9U]|nr:hypothetical protein NOVOSPHI9U_10466 [Novosphingobium sp. 9U]